MMDKRLRSEIDQRELNNSDVDHLHFDNHATRIIESGCKCSLGCLGGNL